MKGDQNTDGAVNTRAEKAIDEDTGEPTKIHELLTAIKNAMEASTRELQEIKTAIQTNECEFAAVRQLLETNSTCQCRGVRSARSSVQPTLDHDDEDDIQQPESAGAKSPRNKYETYRKKPQTPGVIRFVKPGQSSCKGDGDADLGY